MAERAAALVGLADLRHGQRRHRAGADAGAFDRGFKHERIHNGGQHAHGVGGRPRQPILRNRRAAKNIAAADHDAEAYSHLMDGDQVGGKIVDRRLVDAEFLGSA